MLARLLEALKNVPLEPIKKPSLCLKTEKPISETDLITQDWVWHEIGDFIQDGDVVVTEVGTSQFGFPDAVLKAKNVTTITQLFYSSIGYSVGACLGAALAKREQNGEGRVVLIVGDGSLQMTVQEIGTIINHGLSPIIFLINNEGYTVERVIHGPERHYNDIANGWDHQIMLKVSLALV